MNDARLLEHHDAGTGVERLDVIVGEARELLQVLAPRIARPDIGDAVAIADEHDAVAEPRRIHVLGILPLGRHRLEGGEVGDPHRTVLAAAVVAALLVPRVVHAIGDPAAIGRDPALIGARQHHRRLGTARERHGPESRRRGRRGGRAPRGEHDRLAVGRPALHLIRRRMPCESARFAAVGRDHPDIEVARVLAAEGDPAAVGREARIARLPLTAREALRVATGARHDPDVLRVREREAIGAHARRAQHARALGLRGVDGGREGQEQRDSGE